MSLQEPVFRSPLSYTCMFMHLYAPLSFLIVTTADTT